MAGLRDVLRRHPMVAFVSLAYAVSWTAWGLQYAQADPLGQVGTILFLVGGLGPLVAAAVVSRFIGTGDAFLARLTRWRVHPGWYLVAVLGPVLVVLGIVVLDSLVTAGEVDPSRVLPLASLPGLVVSGVLLGGLEEPGWRGFAQEHLQRGHNALVASLVVGVLWIVWHLPLFVIPGTTQSSTPVVPFAMMGFGLAVLFAWVYNSAHRSLPVVVLLHGAYNGALGWSGVLEGGGGGIDPLWLVAVVICGLAVGLVLVSGSARLSMEGGDPPVEETGGGEVPR